MYGRPVADATLLVNIPNGPAARPAQPLRARALAHYAAAEAGVMAFTRCAALDVAGHGIRVNAVAPSLAIHPFLAKVTSEDLLAELAGREAFGRARAALGGRQRHGLPG